MGIGNRIGWMALSFVLLGVPGTLFAGEKPAPLVQSPLAVVESVKENSPAARAGVKPGDRVVELNDLPSPRLQDVLAYRFEWEKGRETAFRFRRGEEVLQARLPQGDWGCEFRADLAEEALARLDAARTAFRRKVAWEEGRKAWEGLAEEVQKAGFPETASWLGIELGVALHATRHGKESEAVLEKWERASPAGSYWAFLSAVELGRACQVAGDLEDAAEAYTRAGDLARNAGNEIRLAGLLVKVFNFELHRGRLPEAKQAAEDLLAIRRRLAPDTLLLSEGFQNLAMVTCKQGDLAAGKALLLASLALKERLAPDSTATATNLNNLGAVSADLGDLAGARDFFQRALAIYERQFPDSLLLASALGNLAIMDANDGNLRQARERMLKALAIQERRAPNSLDVAHTLDSLAGVAINEGDLPAAKKYYRQALAIRERLAPEGLDVAHTLAAMSNVHRKQGDLASARECLNRALVIQERLAPRSLESANALVDLSNVLEEQGDLGQASVLLGRALALQESLAPEGLAVANGLANLGQTVRKQGDLSMARAYYLKALAIRERLTPEALETAYLYTNLGALAFDRGDLASAREYHLKALAMKEKLAPGGLDVAESLSDLGAVTAAQGDLATARDLYLRALAIRERLAPGSLGVADTRNGLGTVLRRQGDLAAARETLAAAITLYGRLAPGSRGEADSLRNLAHVEKDAGAPARRAECMGRAVEALEAQRARVGGESAKTAFSSVTGDFYTDLIAAYLDTKKPPLALETLERSRARTLLELVSSRYVDVRQEIPAALLERQQELAGRRRYLSEQLAGAGVKTDPGEVEAWRSELLMLPQKEDALAEEIRRASPRLAALQYPKPLAYPAMRDALDPGTLLVAFAVGQKESYLFALRRLPPGAKGEELRAVRLPAGRKELENRVMAYRTAVGRPEADAEEWKAAARELFSLLLGPVAKEISGCERILLLPDGPLHLLPFATLMPRTPAGRGKARLDPSQPLGLQRPLSVQASLTVYAGLRPASGPSAKGLVWTGFGDPVYPGPEKAGELPGELAQLRTRGFHLGPLPGSRREIEGIARLFGERARVHLGPEATKESVLKLPERTNLVHFACHGLLDPDFPMNSALALSPSPGKAADGEGAGNDGLLQAWEIIQNLRLESDCVVLSACETGVGRVCGGEGILGLTRAFLHAGTRSVVVSLWPISDESASRFMGAFYEKILDGVPRDEALRRAQAALARQPEFAHPFHWAAFVLVGEGR